MERIDLSQSQFEPVAILVVLLSVVLDAECFLTEMTRKVLSINVNG